MGRKFQVFDEGSWIEVMRTGNYPQGTITDQDLEDMIATYDPKFLEATINLDHGNPKKVLGRVAALKKMGDTMLAKVTGITESLRSMVRDNLLNGFSCEIANKLKETGKKYLTGLAALVNFRPAVKDLAPAAFAEGGGVLIDFYFDQEDKEGTMDFEKIKEWLEQKFKRFEEKFEEKSERAKFSADETKKLIDETRTSLTAEFKQMVEKESAEGKAAKEELAKVKRESMFAGIRAFCEKLAGKVTPAMEKRGLFRFMEFLSNPTGDATIQYSASDGKDAKASPLEWFEGFLTEFKDSIRFEEMVNQKDQKTPSAKDRWDALVAKFSEEKKVPRNMAIREIIKCEPELYKQVQEESKNAKG